MTLVVKTFERPDVLLRLVDSVRRYYPRLPVVVVDDSATPLDPVPPGITTYCRLPFNAGVGAGRNHGLAQAQTDYVLFADDDLVFTERTDLRKMVRVLDRTPFDIVSCAYVDHRGGTAFVNWFEGALDVRDGVFTHHRGLVRGYLAGLPVYDIVHNFFLARRASLGPDPWDPELKTVDHYDFFLRLKERGLLCTRLAGVSVEHRPETTARYAPFRENEAYAELARRKHGIVEERFPAKVFGRRDLLRHRLRRATSALAFAAARASGREQRVRLG